MKATHIDPPVGTPDQPGERLEFRVRGDASPQLLMRIFGLLAQQDHMPQRATLEVAEGRLDLVMVTGALIQHRAEVAAEKMRSMIGIDTVQLGLEGHPTGWTQPNQLSRFASGLRADRGATASAPRRRST